MYICGLPSDHMQCDGFISFGDSDIELSGGRMVFQDLANSMTKGGPAPFLGISTAQITGSTSFIEVFRSNQGYSKTKTKSQPFGLSFSIS